jgi:hypothetical protein
MDLPSLAETPMKTRIILAVATTACAVIPAAGQSAQYAIKKCDELKVPIGALPEGSGTVSYLISKDGRPDTSSIAVLEVSGLSAAAFRSVMARRLAACRFSGGRAGASSTVVSEIAQLDSMTLQVASTTASSPTSQPLPLETLSIPLDSFPLPLNDRRIEERPLRLSCNAARTPPPIMISGRGATRAQAMQDAQDQMRMAQLQQSTKYGGTLVAEVRVGIDGKPGPQVRVIEATNRMAVQALADIIATCRFAPARIRGVAVPSYLVVRVP